MRFILLITIAFNVLFVYTTMTEPTKEEFITITQRRVANTIKRYTPSVNDVIKWKSSISSEGTWPDINMIAGCDARRANWPATTHLDRTLLLASAYVVNHIDETLLDKINLALNYWFENDFKEPDCLERGGKLDSNCPCHTPGLWNTNWYNQIISVPSYVGNICLLLRDNLTPYQFRKCTLIQARSFDTIGGPIPSPPTKYTGANLLDVSSVGFNLALLTKNMTGIQIALHYFYSGAQITSRVAEDGIQTDGSFMQHGGLLYNGNYGKDYINDLLSIFTETKGTSLGPTSKVKSAFATLISGTEWMMVADIKLNSLLWQYSVIGRMISFRYSNRQASGGVAIDFKKVGESAKGWENQKTIDAIVDRLEMPSTDNANQGKLVGTKYFYNADYMVHRAPTYVITMKMYSSRTVNSECVNSQNPFGFHLSDGAIYNYLTGDEYMDTFGAWNWELIPGITVDMFGTPLSCNRVKRKGKKEFVGGATDDNIGIAVMDYMNPIHGNLAFKKTAFFFPSGYAIQVGLTHSRNKTASLVTVLDQRRRNGNIYVSGRLRNTNSMYESKATSSIWHDNMGYYFPNAETIYVNSKPRAADWASIGISRGNEMHQLWTSYIKHSNTLTNNRLLTQYVVQPGISLDEFNEKIHNNKGSNKIPIQLDFKESSSYIHAAYSAADKTIAIAFWAPGNYSSSWWGKSLIIESTKPCVLLFRKLGSNKYRITIADPSQTLLNLNLSFTMAGGTRLIKIKFPTGNNAGKGVVVETIMCF